MAEPKKPWSWRARIAAMPPIDWAALAQEQWDNSRRTRKGDKRPLADVEKQKAARRRNKLARQKAATERAIAAYVPPVMRHRRINSVFTVAHRIALAMQPGEWHARRDVMRAADLRRGSTWARLWTMWQAGMIERAPNPDWKPQELFPGEGVHQAALERINPPVWLWRLTAAGLVLRREAEWLA